MFARLFYQYDLNLSQDAVINQIIIIQTSFNNRFPKALLGFDIKALE